MTPLTEVTSTNEELGTRVPASFFTQPTLEIAHALIGKTLWHATVEGVTAGIIVETEAYYAAVDPAAHGFRGPTTRNRVVFGLPGYAYVYRSYGIHALFNVVTEPVGRAGAVLIRALQPTQGLDLMRHRRGLPLHAGRSGRELARGPGNLSQAMGLTLQHNGADLVRGMEIWISTTPAFHVDTRHVVATPRIGISQAQDLPWRFVLSTSCYVSGRRALLGGEK